MNPDLQNMLMGVIPAIAAFLIGHYHIVLPAKTPATPATPATPPSQPNSPNNPAMPVFRPIGQGGIIDVGAYLIAHIMNSAAASQVKLAAIQKVSEAATSVSPPVQQ